ncbi:UTP--glucose-1-phosphate uridylyltransferase [Thermosulfidibacter takaii ABI70S6]|uniref:UTP--glucose-1-phosphate uridylyltransferase n=1 Tax=Thermosulfidibacter takaii (strain DSM 17441 / JCM 13301 / NBRC 103674 / ABI70S6) TaxID=1298851 RepID=A0A0S3QUD2_THET7|nr:UTP--glucose-1-phosphate uridylyltransferase GalU [Thermosulfidibacter takaii]BAT71928.1 UTP--glucose-1-phosphate uridylyltransferase [Thermosulfidibacter takaii ABI70S6]
MIRKVVFPVAGLGTRFLPATKAMPKEMLPLVDKPLIQYTVEEALNSGIDVAVFVTGRGKRAIEDHFDRSWELEYKLEKSGKEELLNEVRKISEMIEVIYVRQRMPLGLGHAVLRAKEAVGNEPFAVILSDDIVDSERPCIGQLIDVYNRFKAPVIALKKVPEEEVSRYGIIKGKEVEEGLFLIEDMVEKPSVEEAPSNYAIIGRYVLTPDVFEKLEKTKPGKGGEIQLTDALKEMAKEKPFYGLVFEGEHFDCGNKLGFLKATVHFALKRDEFKLEFLDYLRTLVI